MRSTGEMSIYATHRFEALHRWPGASGKVAFLRHPHRHVFHVRAEVKVTHDDRQVEFLGLQRRLEQACARLKGKALARTWSCEHYARALGQALGCTRVEVSEDGENGAVWEAK